MTDRERQLQNKLETGPMQKGKEKRVSHCQNRTTLSTTVNRQTDWEICQFNKTQFAIPSGDGWDWRKFCNIYLQIQMSLIQNASIKFLICGCLRCYFFDKSLPFCSLCFHFFVFWFYLNCFVCLFIKKIIAKEAIPIFG